MAASFESRHLRYVHTPSHPRGSSSWLGETCWWSQHHVRDALDFTDDAALHVCTCPMHLLRRTGSILETGTVTLTLQWLDQMNGYCYNSRARPKQLIPPSFTLVNWESYFLQRSRKQDSPYIVEGWADPLVPNISYSFDVLYIHYLWTTWCLSASLALHKQYMEKPLSQHGPILILYCRSLGLQFTYLYPFMHNYWQPVSHLLAAYDRLMGDVCDYMFAYAACGCSCAIKDKVVFLNTTEVKVVVEIFNPDFCNFIFFE